MIRNTLTAFAAVLLTSCGSVSKPTPPPAINVSAPVNLVFVEISDAILRCPDLLSGIVLPLPDVEGKYTSAQIDAVMLEVYQRGSECGQNMKAVREVYLSAKEKYNNGGVDE